MQDLKKIPFIITISSICIFLALCWFIYLAPKAIETPLWIGKLPLLNCSLNGLSALCLTAGILAIRKKQTERHKKWMFSALCLSALFLVSYLVYHHFHGNTPYLGTGVMRTIYFFTLITHVLGTLIGLPLILITVFYGLTEQFSLHKKIARWTFPIWLYISITGVLIYAFQQI